MNRKGLFILLVLAVLLMGVSVALAQDMAATIMLGGNDELGDFLVDADGMTVYLFTNDEPGVSNCAGDCLTNWPAVTIGEGEAPILADGVPGVVSFIQQDDGSRHVVYNGWPFYYWHEDAAPGDAGGHTRGDVWYVVPTLDVGLGGNGELGSFLVSGNGMTLYTFTNDADGMSACYDQCAENWPPLTVESADALNVQPGLVGDYGTTDRTDGTVQVTYNGSPLYLWAEDAAPGDATGHTRGDVWYAAITPLLLAASDDELGDFLIGPNGMTLYLYTEDTDNTSNCYERCAINWPPLYAGSEVEPMGGPGVDGEIGVTERTDGTLMVMYNGVPLYYWIRDKIPGDTTGQNVGDVWFVLEP
jgi:predicted lipoprotein with Yx(FWY)xxD motif